MNTIDPRDSEHPTQSHADAARQAALDLFTARQDGDDRAARRHLAKLRRSLSAHIDSIRAERSLS